MANVIAQKYNEKKMNVSLMATIYSSRGVTLSSDKVKISSITTGNGGMLYINATAPYSYLYSTASDYIYSLALCVADTNTGGTDYTTDFTLLSNETGKQPVKDYSIIGKWRRTKTSIVNLKLVTYVYSWYFMEGKSSTTGSCLYGEWIQGLDESYPNDPNGRWTISGDNTLSVSWYYDNYKGYDTETYTYSFSDDGNTLVLTATGDDYYGTGGTYTRYE